METIEATFRVVTPMFMSGAEQARAELRLPSIKGALRFWWRALAWERHEGKLEKIREEENRLFGSTDTGQAAVLMRLEVGDPSNNTVDFRSLPGAIYLGYGVMNFRGELTRLCLTPPFEFKLTLLCKKGIKAKEHESLISALQAMSFFGAVGSKARKGYGSISLLRLESQTEVLLPQNSDELKQAMRQILGKLQFDILPSYTAFTKQAQIYVTSSGESALELLNGVGEAMQLYRSWGRNGKVNKQRAKQNFEDDHDDMLAAASGRKISHHPERVVFGLPHNYFFSSTNDKVDVSPASRELDRRASPLFIHIHELTNGRKVSVLTVIPSKFLPEDESILVKSRAGSQYLEQSVDYRVISQFTSEKYFPNITTVLP